ncbi:hypothetical protein BDZ89DRAFT_1132735 [Hymenopellis radicata]|nr:hypothetical protein BDZ89DRAFT_1132735 [Hymenopellis radicata]
MPPLSNLWQFFIKGDKQNTAQYRAHCLGCMEKAQPKNIPINVDDIRKIGVVFKEPMVIYTAYEISHLKVNFKATQVNPSQPYSTVN